MNPQEKAKQFLRRNFMLFGGEESIDETAHCLATLICHQSRETSVIASEFIKLLED